VSEAGEHNTPGMHLARVLSGRGDAVTPEQGRVLLLSLLHLYELGVLVFEARERTAVHQPPARNAEAPAGAVVRRSGSGCPDANNIGASICIEDRS